MVSDRVLVRKCMNGNQEYQKMLYERLSPVLMGICVRYTRNRADAEDVLHDSFVKILTNLETFNEKLGSLEVWAKRITINTAIDLYHMKKRIAGSFDTDEMQDFIGDVRVRQNDFLSEEIMLQFISELPDGYRSVFNMHEIEGFSHTEIMEMTGIGYSTLRSQLSKAKCKLKKKIEAYLGRELDDHVEKK